MDCEQQQQEVTEATPSPSENEPVAPSNDLDFAKCLIFLNLAKDLTVVNQARQPVDVNQLCEKKTAFDAVAELVRKGREPTISEIQMVNRLVTEAILGLAIQKGNEECPSDMLFNSRIGEKTCFQSTTSGKVSETIEVPYFSPATEFEHAFKAAQIFNAETSFDFSIMPSNIVWVAAADNVKSTIPLVTLPYWRTTPSFELSLTMLLITFSFDSVISTKTPFVRCETAPEDEPLTREMVQTRVDELVQLRDVDKVSDPVRYVTIEEDLLHPPHGDKQVFFARMFDDQISEINNLIKSEMVSAPILENAVCDTMSDDTSS